MTRGRASNRAYVAVDQPDAAHNGPHPADAAGATARSVLYGVLQHVGAELSAHETLTAEQDAWGSIAQIAAEYETIAAAAQRDRWATLLRTAGLSSSEAAAAVKSDAFGPRTAELRRAEANHHDVDALLPRLVRAREFGDADDVAAVLRHRVAAATVRPARPGRTRTAPRMIAGLIPEAVGAMADDMRQALEERRDLIEARADAVLDAAVAETAPWVSTLGARPSDLHRAEAWRRSARVVAAYRDRYQITSVTALGASPEGGAKRADWLRAEGALNTIRRIAKSSKESMRDRSQPERSSRSSLRWSLGSS